MTCKNAQRLPGYFVLTRVYQPSGEYHLEPQFIEDTASQLCRSDFDIPKQGACKGCNREQDLDYLKAQGLI